MTTLTIEIDEQTSAGKHLMGFLKTLGFVSILSQKKEAKSGIEKALEDVKNGRVYAAKDVKDLMRQTLK